MKQGLRGNMKTKRCIFGAARRRAMAKLYPTECLGIIHELGTRNQLRLFTELALYFPLLHFGGIGQLFSLCLSREAFLIGTINGITDIEIILCNQQHVLRHK